VLGLLALCDVWGVAGGSVHDCVTSAYLPKRKDEGVCNMLSRDQEKTGQKRASGAPCRSTSVARHWRFDTPKAVRGPVFLSLNPPADERERPAA